MENTKYYYCEVCGSVWEDDSFVYDVECPDCEEEFMDGNIEQITKDEFEYY